MRILIDLTDLHPGEMGGIEQYVRDLIAGFADLKYQEHHFTLLVKRQHVGHFGSLPQHLSYRPVPSGLVAGQFMKRGRLKNIWLARHGINQRHFDVVHFPFQAVRFVISNLPSVVSIMDIQHELHPEFFGVQELTARRYIYPYSVQNASRVISISGYTARSLETFYAVPASHIDVIHLSVNSQSLETAPHRKSWLFYPAASWPHKNHLKLIEAFHIFSKKHPHYELHLSGAKKQATREIDHLIRKLGLNKKVIHHGYVTDQEVARLMAVSRAIIFPSLFEGFGIPVLEAMAHQTPVACSELEVFHEVCADAVLYFDPKSVSAITIAITRIATDEKIRTKLLSRAVKLLPRYTIARMAAATFSTYRKVAHA